MSPAFRAQRASLACLLLPLLLAPAPAAEPVRPSADELLQACIGALPDIPLRVTGELQSRSPEGDLEKRVNVDMTLDWQADPPTARYSTRDAFGKALEHLAVTWRPGAAPEYRFFRGDPLVAAPLPPLTDAIEGTDVTWMDLSLAFLWWTGGHTVGAEPVRGRDCWVVDVAAPADHFGAAAGVRLWLDAKVGAVLRAHVLDAGGTILRRVDAKGFRKINDRWFVQTIEVQSLPSRHTTTLRVREVEDRERRQFIRVDAGGPERPPDEPDRVTPAAP